MRAALAALAGLLLVACSDDGDAGLSEEDAEQLVDAAVDAAVEAADDPPVDTGQDVSMPEAAEAWLECADDAPGELADADVRLEVGIDDILVARAVAYDGDVAPVVDAATPDCVADAWGDQIEDALDDLGLGGGDVELDSEGDDGEATVTGELAGFPIGFEARVAAADDIDVVVVVLGGGSDVDGAAAGMVQDVLDAMLEAVEEAAG